MAKKIQIGLAVYALDDRAVSVCDGCNTAFEYPKRLYEAIKYDKPGKHYCLGCIKKMQVDFQEKAKKQATPRHPRHNPATPGKEKHRHLWRT